MLRPTPLYLVLALLLVTGLSGCTEGPEEGSGGAGGDDTGDDGEGDGDLGPFTGADPKVVAVPLPAGQPGAVEGHVYNMTNGAPIGQATVTATCFRQALPGVEPQENRTLPVTQHGLFAMKDTGAWADCTKITYTIEAPGYTIRVPLEAGPLVPGMKQVVYGGMTPAP